MTIPTAPQTLLFPHRCMVVLMVPVQWEEMFSKAPVSLTRIKQPQDMLRVTSMANSSEKLVK